jgi:hypothetical protein
MQLHSDGVHVDHEKLEESWNIDATYNTNS